MPLERSCGMKSVPYKSHNNNNNKTTEIKEIYTNIYFEHNDIYEKNALVKCL